MLRRARANFLGGGLQAGGERQRPRSLARARAAACSCVSFTHCLIYLKKTLDAPPPPPRAGRGERGPRAPGPARLELALRQRREQAPGEPRAASRLAAGAPRLARARGGEGGARGSPRAGGAPEGPCNPSALAFSAGASTRRRLHGP